MSGTGFGWGWTPKLGLQGRIASVRTFLRLLGLVYLTAFVSFGVQAPGLLGKRGILPFGEYLQAAREALGAAAYRNVPTLLWIVPTDTAMTALWLAGCLWALIAVFGRWQRPAMAVCLVLWLSLCAVGQDFYSFQWDILLSEAGFLAIFADAARVRICADSHAGHLDLQIADDGAGFSEEERHRQAEAGHIGLRLILDLARDSGGELVIQSAPHSGTTLRAHLPIGSEAAQPALPLEASPPS